MPILSLDRYPSELQGHPEVAGVFVGGCVSRGDGSRFHAKAHVHLRPTDKYFHWMCFLSERRLQDKMLVLHELAHVLTGVGHIDKWREKVLELGGTLDPVMERSGKGVLLRSYQKKSRYGR